MLIYLTIGGTAVAAALGAPVWIVLVGAITLTLVSASDYRKLASSTNFTFSQMMLFGGWRSMANATATSAAAYMLGRLALLTV